MAFKWEQLKDETDGQKRDYTQRAKIPGGWLVKSKYIHGVGLTFVPDPNHQWDGNSLD